MAALTALDFGAASKQEMGARARQSNRRQGVEPHVVEHIEKFPPTIRVTAPGYHPLRMWKSDPSIAVDRIVIDTGSLEPS